MRSKLPQSSSRREGRSSFDGSSKGWLTALVVCAGVVSLLLSSSPPSSQVQIGAPSVVLRKNHTPRSIVPPKGPWQSFEAAKKTMWGQHEACFVMGNDGLAYLIGGRKRKPVCAYHPPTHAWDCNRNKVDWRLHHASCLAIDDEIWIPTSSTGSYPTETPATLMYIYHPASDTWRNRTGLPSPRARGAAAAVYDAGRRQIYVSHGNRGGHDEYSQTVAWLDRYDLATDTWTALADGIVPRDHTGGAWIDGDFCVAAGRNSRHVSAVVHETECYHLARDQWTIRASLAVGRAGAAYGQSCGSDAFFIVVGGESEGQAHSEVSVFDGQDWHEDWPALLQARHGTGLAVDCLRQALYIASGSPHEGGPASMGGLQNVEHLELSALATLGR
jgi:hypothetical protein